MHIAIGSDHAAWEAKTELVAHLRAAGHQVDDLGTHNGDSTDYPRFAHAVARKVAAGTAERGFLLCGSGIGMSIAANKVRGARAALVHDENTAGLARKHNDANIACLGARLIPTDAIISIAEVFLDTAFEGGRHATRVGMIEPATSC